MNEVLLGIMGSLVAAFIWTVRRLFERSEARERAREAEMATALAALTDAVKSFQNFERTEGEIHARLARFMDELERRLTRLDDKADTILNEIRKR